MQYNTVQYRILRLTTTDNISFQEHHRKSTEKSEVGGERKRIMVHWDIFLGSECHFLLRMAVNLFHSILSFPGEMLRIKNPGTRAI